MFKIPANCTNRLQPMDLSVNKAVKDFMRNKFIECYFVEVMERLKGDETRAAIDFKLTMMKPLVTKWLIKLFDYLSTNSSAITNGFKAAGIEEALVKC